MYVFGEEDYGRPLGPTSSWSSIFSRAPGSSLQKCSNNRRCNVRILPCMWPAPNERKIYVMYGSADRLLAVKHAPGGADIDSQKWGRERLRGNYPEPKQPARGCENVLWVPSCDSMNTIKSKCNMQKGSHTFTFFGDTFLSSIVRPGIWVILW
ncbi:hypothetical protein GG344DRAFT_52923 [Lentinula edodes]|nr:hypothetical protein GG344DRAFT_52923 [Lentinula edodes]